MSHDHTKSSTLCQVNNLDSSAGLMNVVPAGLDWISCAYPTLTCVRENSVAPPGLARFSASAPSLRPWVHSTASRRGARMFHLYVDVGWGKKGEPQRAGRAPGLKPAAGAGFFRGPEGPRSHQNSGSGLLTDSLQQKKASRICGSPQRPGSILR
jgi:hypothetical protein